MPKRWKRSEDQQIYLDSYVANFVQARMDNRLERFKSDLYEGWFNSWPEEAEVFGDTWKKGDHLTHDDMRALGAAIETRKEQLYNYVRWHANGKIVRAQAPGILRQLINKERKPFRRSRRDQKLELYSRKYYSMRFKNHVDKEVADTTPPNETKKCFNKRRLIIYRKWRSLSWQMESEEVKSEIEALWNNKNATEENSGDDEDADGESDLDDTEHPGYRGCIDQLGKLLTSFLRELQDETGWAFTIIGGGLNHEGKDKVVASHVGKTATGSTFPDICNNYEDNILQEFLAFIKLRHPIEERLACAQLNNEQQSGVPSQDKEISQASANGTPTEEQAASNQHKETMGVVEIRTEKNCSGSMNPAMLSHVGDVPAASENNGFPLTSLPVSQPNAMMGSAPSLGHALSLGHAPSLGHTPSLGHSASAPSLGHTPSLGHAPSLGHSNLYLHDVYDDNWMPHVSSSPRVATPMMNNAQLPYENLSPMSRFLAMIDQDHQPCDTTLSANSSESVLFYGSTNMVSTAMTPNPELTNNMNIQLPIHTPSIPNPQVLTPHDINCRFGLDPMLPCSNPGSSIQVNEVSVNKAIETHAPSTTLMPELENRGDNLMAPVKPRKRARKGEVDTSFVLPEGTARAHKPRQMPDETCWEGPARRRSRKKD